MQQGARRKGHADEVSCGMADNEMRVDNEEPELMKVESQMAGSQVESQADSQVLSQTQPGPSVGRPGRS